MESEVRDVWRTIRWPAAIALGVTLARLIGELAGGPEALFNRAAGGAGALVGIAWLAPVFGGYFGVKLARAGRGPASSGRVVAFVFLGLLAALAIIVASVALTGDPNVPGDVSLAGVFGQQLGFTVATAAALLLVWKTWPAFFEVMLAYAVASRLPVVVVMLVAMSAGWGTHYELAAPGYPEMGLATKFVATALFPQLTSWIAYTVLFGGLVGGIAAAVVRSPSASPAASGAV